MINQRPKRIQLPPSPYGKSWLLYIFKQADKQQAVWLHKINADSEFIYGSDYTWRCSCGANDAGLAGPLTAELLRSAWSHFDGHLDPAAIPLHGPLARWYRGGQEPDLDALFKLEVERILGHAPEPPVEVVHVCGMCGESFEISDQDPHWATGQGPLCPKAQHKLEKVEQQGSRYRWLCTCGERQDHPSKDRAAAEDAFMYHHIRLMYTARPGSRQRE